jgi:hypothetical protein
MKHALLALALLGSLSQVALASEICDINGCRQASGSEEFWNEWYLNQYGHSYDSGYRRFDGYDDNYKAVTCSAWDSSRRVIAQSASINGVSAKRRALKACVARSAHPNTCRVSCN